MEKNCNNWTNNKWKGMNTYRLKLKAEQPRTTIHKNMWQPGMEKRQKLRGHDPGTSCVKPTSALLLRPPQALADPEIGWRGDIKQRKGNSRHGSSCRPEPLCSPAPVPATGGTPTHSAPRRARAQAAVPSSQRCAAAEPAAGRLWQPRARRPRPQQRG